MNIPLDSDDEDQLLLSRDVEAALLLGNAVEADLLTLGIAVLLDVLLSTLEDNLALGLCRLRSKLVSSLTVDVYGATRSSVPKDG